MGSFSLTRTLENFEKWVCISRKVPKMGTSAKITYLF